MTLAHLFREYEDDFIQSPLEILDWKRQLLEPNTQLTDLEWVGTIYFDPTVFSDGNRAETGRNTLCAGP